MNDTERENWVPASLPPPVSEKCSDWHDGHDSDVVLVFDGREMFCAKYCFQPGSDRKISWRTTCSEGWDVTDIVTHWQPLPEPPKT